LVGLWRLFVLLYFLSLGPVGILGEGFVDTQVSSGWQGGGSLWPFAEALYHCIECKVMEAVGGIEATLVDAGAGA